MSEPMLVDLNGRQALVTYAAAKYSITQIRSRMWERHRG